MTDEAQDVEGELPARPTTVAMLDLVRWHLDRYDRLRTSTTARAAVILNATAILSAGNAVLLTLVLGNAAIVGQGPERVLLVIGVALTAFLVLAGLIRATTVLATSKDSRSTFTAGSARPRACCDGRRSCFW